MLELQCEHGFSHLYQERINSLLLVQMWISRSQLGPFLFMHLPSTEPNKP